MATLFLTSASPGAPVLSASNGSLCEVLDWALLQNGWTIAYTATNARVYRPGAGHRRYLFVAHDSALSGDARLATIRGCEGATGASEASLVDPFPRIADLSATSSSLLISSAAGATRSYEIVVGVDFVIVAVSAQGSNAQGWDFCFFGDAPPSIPGDQWNTVVHVGSSTTTSGTTGRAMGSAFSPGLTANAKTFWCRSIDGSIKSSQGCLYASVTSSPSSAMSTIGAPIMRGGYQNRIVREYIGITDIASQTTTAGVLAISRRAWLPHLWHPMHSTLGSVTANDTFSDSAYHPSARFHVIPASSGVALILETTDTWSPPNG